MFGKNANSAQALYVTTAIAAVLATMPSAQAQVPPGGVPAVSVDPNAVLSATSVAFPGFAVNPAAQQFFSIGTALPSLVYRNLFDYVGIAIPPISSQAKKPGTPGLQDTNPAGSPRLPNAQFNYVNTGSDNGRLTFIGAAPISTLATYTPSLLTPNVCISPSCAGASVPYATGSLSFAGTEFPLTAGELSTYNTRQLPTRGNPIQVPTVFGGIAVAYNQTGGPTGIINLSTADLCRIYDGTISNYNQLTPPSTTISASLPISVYIRAFGSSPGDSITNAFTSFLANACPAAIGGPYFLSFGVNTFPAGAPPLTGPNYSNFIQANGSDLTVNALGSVPGSIGYIGASFSNIFQVNTPDGLNPAPTAARLQVGGNSATFVQPLTANVRAAIANGLTLIPNVTYPTTVFTIGGLVSSTPSVIPTAANSYPITIPTYLLAYTRYATSATTGNGPVIPNAANALKSFLNAFLFANRTTPINPNDQLVQQLGFSLPDNSIRATLRNAVNTITQVP
jgi:ABC-type phosphate transport system substrate-binding protein